MPQNPYDLAAYYQQQKGPLGAGQQPPGIGGAPQAPQAGSMSAAEQAQIAALLSTYGDQQELGAMDAQMAQAEALRMATPEMRNAGRVYVAANPLEHIGKGIGDYKLMKKRQQYEKDSAATRGRIGGNVAKYGEIATKDL